MPRRQRATWSSKMSSETALGGLWCWSFSSIVLKKSNPLNTIILGFCQQILYTFKLFGFADGIMMKWILSATASSFGTHHGIQQRRSILQRSLPSVRAALWTAQVPTPLQSALLEIVEQGGVAFKAHRSEGSCFLSQFAIRAQLMEVALRACAIFASVLK